MSTFLRFCTLFSTLLASGASLAGERTWIILNNAYKGSISLSFDGENPCLTRPLLAEWGVIESLLERLSWSSAGCLTPKSAKEYELQYWYLPDAQLLTLLFPEEGINAQQNGVSTSRWDNGINALLVNYRMELDNQARPYQWERSGTEARLELDNGVNVGPWRLRYQNTFWREKGGDHGSYTRSVSLWRNITSLRSRLTFGDGYTSGAMFDSLDYRGISLASDEAMYPDAWRPFAPWINGYARTEAEVTIHQNGERVYSIHVPPGSFTIRDFYPPAPEGNLELRIQESDGTERTRILPYSAMPNLVNYNNFNYELTAGRYKPARGTESGRDKFWQASLSWGIAPKITLFSGVQQAENWASQVVGIGGNLNGWGAISADISSSQYQLDKHRYHGNVWRLRYAKAFFSTETSISALLQSYPKGSHYRSLEEKIDRAATMKYWTDDDTTRRALRGQLEVNQNVGEDTNLSLSWNWMKSRKQGGSTNGLTFSLNTLYRDVDVRVYAGYERWQHSPAEATIGLNVSIPFTLGGQTVNVGYLNNLASRGKDSHGVNVYGSALKDYSLRYDVTAQHEIHGNDDLQATLGYQYNAGETNIGYHRTGSLRGYHLDSSGSIVMHSGGVTFGQTLGNTVALVDVPDTPDIGFYNQFGAKTNAKGELLVSYLTAWRVNRITVDSTNVPDGKAFENEELEAVPTDGAIVRVSFLPPQPAPPADSEDTDPAMPTREEKRQKLSDSATSTE